LIENHLRRLEAEAAAEERNRLELEQLRAELQELEAARDRIRRRLQEIKGRAGAYRSRADRREFHKLERIRRGVEAQWQRLCLQLEQPTLSLQLEAREQLPLL
jgi:uncharacterized protein YhaN